MAEYEIILTGENILAQLNTLCAIEPGVYGKRWNPDGSLAVMVRAVADGHERSKQDLLAALEQAEQRTAPPEQAEPPKSRTARRSSPSGEEPEA